MNLMKPKKTMGKMEEEKMEGLKLSSPWVTLFREIAALFNEDPEIKVVFDENDNNIKLYVENQRKADALAKLLPAERTYGNVTVKITVIPANVGSENRIALYREAFAGNPVLAYADSASNIVTGNVEFVVFKKEVVQYFNDDLRDIHGLCSTLYQDIAKDVFGEQTGLYFCTDTEEVDGDAD